MVEQIGFSEILGDLESKRETPAKKERFDVILKHFNQIGMTLETAGDSKHLDRCQRTMQKLSRDLGLRWPDYTPRKLRAIAAHQ